MTLRDAKWVSGIEIIKSQNVERIDEIVVSSSAFCNRVVNKSALAEQVMPVSRATRLSLEQDEMGVPDAIASKGQLSDHALLQSDYTLLQSDHTSPPSDHSVSMFGHALSEVSQPYHNEIVERFCGGNKVFVAGEIVGRKDLDVVSYVCNANGGQKCIIIPHEIYEEGLHKIIASIDGKSLLYSECSTDTDFSDVQVLIIDFLGALPEIYRFCRFAYVGGGFRSCRDAIALIAKTLVFPFRVNLTSSLRYVAEAAVYGLPVAFGPRIRRKPIAAELIALGVGKVVRNGKDLDKWVKGLMHDEQALADISDMATSYMKGHSMTTGR